jgi:hypothetical protein
MEQAELLKYLAKSLDELHIPYLLTGSMATIAYGEPRFTNDIDVVVAMTAGHVQAFCAAFHAPDFYCPREVVEEAVRQKFQFNILHPESGLKVDVIMASDSAFDRSRLGRGVRLPAGADFEATFAAPEDVIVKKLQYFREGGSEKHLRDIVGVLKVQGERIDQVYLADWVARLDLGNEWQLIVARLSGETSQ